MRLVAIIAAVLAVGFAPTLVPSAQGQPLAGFPPAKPIAISGTGSRVVTLRIARPRPAVVTYAHRGSANFIVELLGGEFSDLLVNDIGSVSGQAVAEDLVPGRRYRLKVTASGRWTIRIGQPGTRTAKRLTGTLRGRGSGVVVVRADDDAQPIIALSHRGKANFIVSLIPYGRAGFSELVANEIGRYTGETTPSTPLDGGFYLLEVLADGVWSIRFS